MLLARLLRHLIDRGFSELVGAPRFQAVIFANLGNRPAIAARRIELPRDPAGLKRSSILLARLHLGLPFRPHLCPELGDPITRSEQMLIRILHQEGAKDLHRSGGQGDRSRLASPFVFVLIGTIKPTSAPLLDLSAGHGADFPRSHPGQSLQPDHRSQNWVQILHRVPHQPIINSHPGLGLRRFGPSQLQALQSLERQEYLGPDQLPRYPPLPDPPDPVDRNIDSAPGPRNPYGTDFSFDLALDLHRRIHKPFLDSP